MNQPPIPLIFQPLFKPKPWGGRKLAELYHKPLPPDELIGESWELVSLPGNESRVRDGPLAGHTLTELVEDWGPALYGDAELINGRFPLLIKLLDARENLSVQVHPNPAAGRQPAPNDIKHEAWYVLHAEPAAELFIGLNPGVTVDEVAAAANSARIAGLLRRWPASPGDCFYLPSGVPHALGAGLVVAEVQTPSDTTYRLYDWGRVSKGGPVRKLDLDQALRNIRLDVSDGAIVRARPPIQQSPNGSEGHSESRPRPLAAASGSSVRLATCGHFALNQLDLPPAVVNAFFQRQMTIWIIVGGHGAVVGERDRTDFHPGDTLLIPSDNRGCRVQTETRCRVLDVFIPRLERKAPDLY